MRPSICLLPVWSDNWREHSPRAAPSDWPSALGPEIMTIAIMSEESLGGRFTFPGTSLTVQRMGYGAMLLAGPGVFGPPKDPEVAITVLREGD